MACSGETDETFATGNVSGGAYGAFGGLIGQGEYIQNSYSIGKVQGGASSSVGGLVGRGDKIQYSYATGAPTGGASSTIGGFIGNDNFPGSLFEDYWDTESSGTSVSDGYWPNDTGVFGFTTSQLQARIPAGFSKKIWHEGAPVANGLPYLAKLPPQGAASLITFGDLMACFREGQYPAVRAAPQRGKQFDLAWTCAGNRQR